MSSFPLLSSTSFVHIVLSHSFPIKKRTPGILLVWDLYVLGFCCSSRCYSVTAGGWNFLPWCSVVFMSCMLVRPFWCPRYPTPSLTFCRFSQEVFEHDKLQNERKNKVVSARVSVCSLSAYVEGRARKRWNWRDLFMIIEVIDKIFIHSSPIT